MTVKEILKRAQTHLIIRATIIWNPYVNRAFYCGSPQDIPETLSNKKVLAYRYDKDKQRMIIRISTF